MEEVTNEWLVYLLHTYLFWQDNVSQNCKEMDLYTNFTTSKKLAKVSVYLCLKWYLVIIRIFSASLNVNPS